ncbi:MAG: gene transfer agent family protein [Blastochloris sp.]|nr:gene transfer agent family protein [Blastochloris sp.]
MANCYRGEIEAELSGACRRLVLTLGALAELEDALGVADLSALAARFESGRLGARDVAAILGAGLRGAGEAVSDAEVMALTHKDGAHGLVRLAADLLMATFADEHAANPPSAGDAALAPA